MQRHGVFDSESIDSAHQNDLRIKQLDSELLDARTLLGEQQQDLDAMTEELQSTNEELMTANEELLSTNEELQSVNEELFTVNSEYQEKIDELTQGNQDLDNLLNATEVGVIYLDKHLLIRRFTPKTREYINLLSLDLNRPFTDISSNFEIEEIETHLKNVLRSQKSTFLLINELNDKPARVLLTLKPYLSTEGHSEGLIMVFQDLSDLQAAEKNAIE